DIEPGKKFDLEHASDEKLAQMQTHKNDWFTRRARLLLQERAAAGKLDAATSRSTLLKLFSDNADPVVRLRAMWALYLSQCVDENWLLSQLKHADEHVRVWAVRFITDSQGTVDSAGWSPIAEKFLPLAGNDKSG